MPISPPLRLAFLFALGSLIAFGGSQLLDGRKRYVSPGSVQLETLLPARFGSWREVPTAFAVVDPTDSGDARDAAAFYDSILTRSYRRADGAEVMLTLAYRRVQKQESKIHRPELCYFAQGYALGDERRIAVETTTGTVPALSFVAKGNERSETVLYWIRIADRISRSAWQTRWTLFDLGLRGAVPDGILVRASVVSTGSPTAQEIARNRLVLADFLRASTDDQIPSRRWVLTGGPAALAAIRS